MAAVAWVGASGAAETLRDKQAELLGPSSGTRSRFRMWAGWSVGRGAREASQESRAAQGGGALGAPPQREAGRTAAQAWGSGWARSLGRPGLGGPPGRALGGRWARGG